MIKISCALTTLLFVGTAFAQDFNTDQLVGQIFWVRPAPELFRRLEFYRQPNLNAVTFYPPSKKSFRIVSVIRGWIKLNFISSFNIGEEAFLPLGYLKRNTYTSKIYSDYAFNRATFFNEDPDDIKERAKAAEAAPVTPKSADKSVASKFFRHKKRCCGLDGMAQPDNPYKKTPTPQ